MQAGAYQNSTFVIATAKCGVEDGHPLFGGSCIVNPDGEIIAAAKTDDDELVVATIDLDDTNSTRKRSSTSRATAASSTTAASPARPA